MKRIAWLIVAGLLILGLWGCGSDEGSQPPSKLPIPVDTPEVNAITEESGIYYAVLDDGRKFQLDAPDKLESLASQVANQSAPETQQLTPSQALPEYYGELIKYQTLNADGSFRNQRRRGTCTSFALAAALEAFYNRNFGIELDLSEQFINHMAQMSAFESDTPTSASKHENLLGTEGGYPVSLMFRALEHFRIPLESQLPYITKSNSSKDPPYDDYEATNQNGDVPRINTESPSTPQEVYDDFNLNSYPRDYRIPSLLDDFTPLPQDALKSASYGIESFVFANQAQISDPSWYERTLVSGHEIVIAIRWCGTSNTEDNIWYPSGLGKRLFNDPKDCPGHALLVVGYDRSVPDQHYLIVKNSWGRRGFTYLSYDWIRNARKSLAISKITEAGYISAAVSPTSPSFNPNLVIGRWNLLSDQHLGILDIYRLPGILRASDYRIGTYFDAEGTVYRVNGTLSPDGNLDFYIDFSNPNLNRNTLQGTRFSGTLSNTNTDTINGSYSGAEGNSIFTLTKGPNVLDFTASPTSGAEPLLVSFNWSVLHHTDVNLICTLDAGDGSPVTTIDHCSNNQSGFYTYRTPGSYTTKLTIEDSLGRSNAVAASITVTSGTTPATEISGTITNLPPSDDWRVIAYDLTAQAFVGESTALTGLAGQRFTLDISGLAPAVALNPFSPPTGVSLSPANTQLKSATLLVFDDADSNGVYSSGERVYLVNDPANTFARQSDKFIRLWHGDQAYSITGESKTTEDDLVTWDIDIAADGWARWLFTLTNGGSEVLITESSTLSSLDLRVGEQISGSSAGTLRFEGVEDEMLHDLLEPR